VTTATRYSDDELRQLRREAQIQGFIDGREVALPHSELEVAAVLAQWFSDAEPTTLRQAGNEIDGAIRRHARFQRSAKIKRGLDGLPVYHAVRAPGPAQIIDALDRAIKSGKEWRFARAWGQLTPEALAWILCCRSGNEWLQPDAKRARGVRGIMSLPHPDVVAGPIAAAKALVPRHGRPPEREQDAAVAAVAWWWSRLSGEPLTNPDRAARGGARLAGWLDLLRDIVAVHAPAKLQFTAFRSGSAAHRAVVLAKNWRFVGDVSC
jgi:hypothetical protein